MSYRLLGCLWILTGLCLLPASAFAETRVALVIGNSNYKTVTVLPNPANDAKVMTELLTASKFEVVSSPDLSQTEMRRSIREFADYVAKKGPDTVALIYFAGHGLQVEGENYLVPVDARIERESDVAIEAVRLVDVMSALSTAPSKTRIVILDACRNNPFGSINATTGRGLAIVDAPTGSIVSYATAPGSEAEDGRGDNSPFTLALAAAAREPNLSIELAFKRTRLSVHKATDGRQTPWESSSLTNDFSFFGSPAAGSRVASGAGTVPKTASEGFIAVAKPAGFWRKELQSRSASDAFEMVIRENDLEGYEEFVALYGSSPFAPRMRSLLERRREMMTWYTATTVNTQLAYDAFLERYPSSDLAATARRMRDRSQARAQSANLARGMAGIGNQPAPAPRAIPASLPAPACQCSAPPRRAEPRPAPVPVRVARPIAPPRYTPPPPRYAPPPRVYYPPPPRRVGPPVVIRIGGGIGRPGGHRPPVYIPGRRHR